MRFYKGGVTWSDFQHMTLVDIVIINNNAARISKEEEKAIKNGRRN